jgi:hypothetical protein
MVGEKWKLIFLLLRTAAIYIDCGATSDVFSAHDGTCTLNVWALYVLYDLYYSYKQTQQYWLFYPYTKKT